MQPRTRFYAFFHWLNLLFLVGVGAAAIQRGQPEVLLGGLALEALWLFAGARVSGFQRYAALRNGQIEKKLSALRSLESQQKLSYEYKQRYRDLEKQKAQLLDAAKANKRLELGAIAPELTKIDELLESFIRIAVAHKKLTQYLSQTTQTQLESDVQKAKSGRDAQPSAEPLLVQSLQAQLELAERRLAEHGKIVQTEKALAVQLETIEKTLGYLKTKIVSLEKPQERQEIESVVMGVEAAERTLEATDKIEAELRQLEQRAIAR